MLDDLTSIQSFTGAVSQTQEEEQQKQWAGGVGFIVTLGKSYYWQANTQQEKQFFIAGLVRIYAKYTGGKVPQLSGFEQRELDQLVGSSRSLPPSQTQSPSTPVPSYPQVQNRPPPRDPSREPGLRSQASRDGIQRPSAQASPIGGPSPVGGPSPTTRPPMRSRRMESPNESFDSTTTLATQQSQPALRRVAAANQSQESFGRSDDASSLPPRSRSGLNGVPNAPGRFPDRSVTPTSQRATTPDSAFSTSRDISEDAPPVPAPLTLPPERRRPPLPVFGDSFQRAQNLDENIIPAPLASPGMRRDDLRPPIRSSERAQPRERDSDTMGNLSPQPIPNGSQVESPRSISGEVKRGEVSQSPLSTKAVTPSQPAMPSPVIRTPQAEPEEETRPGLGPMIKQKSPLSETPAITPLKPQDDTRPGLGPMIKHKSPVTSPSDPPPEPEGEARPGLGPMIRKKSRPEIANAFLNAAKSASALSTFKPRAGGAAEKLREAAAKAQAQERGPDGITGVIPAPGLVRATGSNSNLTTPTRTPIETPSTSKEKETPLENKSISSKAAQSSGTKVAMKAPKDGASADNPTIREAKRQKPASETMQKELSSLGIDPIVLGGKGNDLIAVWDEFGWAGEGVHTKNIDQMKEEIERELNKVQAGGWLNRLEEEDERVEAIKAGLDRCIDECDELDGLLTLYLVELSVRSHVQPPLFYTDLCRHSTRTLLLLKLNLRVSKSKPQIRSFFKPSSNLCSIPYRFHPHSSKVSLKLPWSPLAGSNKLSRL
jgi:exocyst complex component 1